MELARLGPLEQAILRAVLQAEAMGSAHSLPALWCCLPNYKTGLVNVRAAVAEGTPLRRYLSASRGNFSLRDREDLLQALPRERWKGDQRWNEAVLPIRGLARLPYIEGVALAGTMAWGRQPEPGQPIELVVLAEGGRTAQASRVIGLYLRSRPAIQRMLRVVELIDCDHLERPDGGEVRALALLTLRPVVAESGFEALWTANPWLMDHFPNFRSGAFSLSSLTDPYLGEREDGTLATLRRRVVDAASDGEPALMTTARRHGGLLGRLEETIRGRSPLLPGPGSEVSLASLLDSQVMARWEELATWEWPLEDAPLVDVGLSSPEAPTLAQSPPEADAVSESESDDPATIQASEIPEAQDAPEAPVAPESELENATVAGLGPSQGRMKAAASSTSSAPESRKWRQGQFGFAARGVPQSWASVSESVPLSTG